MKIIIWSQNPDKRHLLLSNTSDNLSICIGNKFSCNNNNEKISGIYLDNKLNFNTHINALREITRSCKGIGTTRLATTLKRIFIIYLTTLHRISYLSHDTSWDVLFIPRHFMGYPIYTTTLHGMSYLYHDTPWDVLFIPRHFMGCPIYYHDTSWDILFIPRHFMGCPIYTTTLHGMSYLYHEVIWYPPRRSRK